ncbi:hypothetical protein [Burkholderia sp. IMCC1007]|uniref:hypothetical protein n=1 Tax=Burkholderia sp. IMCC1007 TaxID=3004104 RepID=UPI0022B496F1|nr:hypothetical protein [Burkholderia sp. IMCC1007]
MYDRAGSRVKHDRLGNHGNYTALLPNLDDTVFTYVFADLRGLRRFHVVGHSMTGMATQRISADAPSRSLAPKRTAAENSELRALPDAGMSAVFRDDRGGFPAGRGRSSVAHARRPEKMTLAAAA